MLNHIKSLTIDKIVSGGYGLARSASGKVILVHGVIPGEVVDVQVFKAKKSYDLGFVTAIVTPSPQRITPPCPLFGQCGGCTLQHLSYDDQFRIKQDVFLADWTRFCEECGQQADVALRKATEPLGYRQRIRLHVIDGEPCFYRHHSNKPVIVEECLLAEDSINTCLQAMDSLPVYQDIMDHVSELVLHHNPEQNNCFLELFFTRKVRPTDQKRIRHLLDLDLIQGIRVYGRSGELLLSLGDHPHIHYAMANKYGQWNFSLIPGDFCQINMEQNQAMLDFIMDHINHDQPQRILDLFCGLGNFSIPLSTCGHHVTGIDLKRSSIRSAERNSLINKTDPVFVRTSAKDGLHNEIGLEGYDIVILDPPRAGFKEGAADLHKLGVQTIFYISCDQQTQIRDLAQIVNSGYTVKKVCLVDMFPQTHHLESIVILEKV